MEEVEQQTRATKREQILEAASGVFAQKGFHTATVRDVARAAGVADGTIYNHFENKTALLLGILDRMTEAARAQTDPAALADLDLRGFVRAFLTQPLVVFEADNFALFRVLVSEVMVNPELRGHFYGQVLGPMLQLAEAAAGPWARRQGLSQDRLQLALHTVSGLVMGVILQRVMGDEVLEARWETLPDTLTDLLVDGLAGEGA